MDSNPVNPESFSMPNLFQLLQFRHIYKCQFFLSIAHCTVALLKTWSLSGSEAGVDFRLDTGLASTQGQVTMHTTVEVAIAV